MKYCNFDYANARKDFLSYNKHTTPRTHKTYVNKHDNTQQNTRKDRQAIDYIK